MFSVFVLTKIKKGGDACAIFHHKGTPGSVRRR